MSANLNADSAAIVEFTYTGNPAEDKTVKFVVPATLLWSADGLKEMFERTRESFLVNPGREGFDEDAWESWHLVSVKEDTEYFVLIEKGTSLTTVDLSV